MFLRFWIWWHRDCEVVRVSVPSWDSGAYGYLCKTCGRAK